MPAIRDTSSTRAAGNGATPTNHIYGSRSKQTARKSSNNGPPGWWNTELRDVGSDEELSGDDDDDQDSVAVEASYVEDILLLSHDKDGIHCGLNGDSIRVSGRQRVMTVMVRSRPTANV